jgi:hypothetical protein
MTTKKNLVFIAILSCFLLQSCYNDDSVEKRTYVPGMLDLKSDSLDVAEGHTIELGFGNGGGIYSVTSTDTNIVKASLDTTMPKTSPTTIYIKMIGKQKGNTTILVSEKKSGEHRTLYVRVTDFYMALYADSSNVPYFPKGQYMFLIANDAHSCLVYQYKHKGGNPVLPKKMASGNYSFSKKDSTYLLTLKMSDGQEDTYEITASKIALYDIGSAFGFDTPTPTKEDFRNENGKEDSSIRLKGLDNAKQMRLKCTYSSWFRIPELPE